MQGFADGVIGRYKIDRKIGSGGMAYAYRCRLDGPAGFQKFVLVKILHPERLEDVEHLRLFMAEARLCARLDHPNIPAVFELGEQDGLPFMVMEYVDGPNLVMLHRKLREGVPRHYGHIAHVFSRVARALHHAHSLKDASGKPLNIIHRDVSLANILVGQNGHTKLIDWGIAHWEPDETALREADATLKGKIRYLAPEQFAAGDLDARVDIYQAGVALYWLACGRPPFSTEAVMSVGGHRMPKWPTEVRKDFPEALERVVLRCLASDPADRFQTAAQLADALDAFTTLKPQFASSDEAVGRWIRSLFPEQELDVFQRLDAAEGQEGHNVTRPLPGHTSEITTGTYNMPQPQNQQPGANPPPSSERISAVGWAGLVMVAIVASIMTTTFNSQRNAAQKKAAFSAYTEENPDAAGAMLLDQAEALLESDEIAAARAMLIRAERIEGGSPDLIVRLSRLNVEVERKKKLAGAQRALSARNYDRAFTAASEVLDMLPEDEDALAILREIQSREDADAKLRAKIAEAEAEADGERSAREDLEKTAADAETRARKAEQRAREAEARAKEAAAGGN
jgi:serine/threonine protein kinase